MIDHQVSNTSLLYPLNMRYSGNPNSAYFGYGGEYRKLTDGRRRNLHEQVTLAVSPTIEEVFHYPSNPRSTQKDFLTNKVVVDLWRGNFADHQATLQTLANRGLTDLFVILHRWQHYGYDDGLPTTYPAGNSFGGPEALRTVSNLCQINNYSFALHTNYTEAYENSPDWNPANLILNSDGGYVRGWYNKDTKRWSYSVKSAQALHYAGIYEPLIHADYRTTAAFLDVHTATLPGNRTDQDATIADPGRQAVVLQDYRTLVANTRDMHNGPVAGEGFGYTTWLWAGYVDAIEADPRSKDDIDSGQIGSTVPTLVDYKLRALHQLFVPHGVGYLERFYPETQNSFTTAELERYRATELAFGNAGFISDLFGRNFSSERAINEAVREYCVMKSLQIRYLASTPQTIRYYRNNSWQTLSDALRAVLPTVTFDNVDAALSEQLGMVQVVYANGLTLYVNRTTNRNQAITWNGTQYTLPPNGFLAHQGNDFLAYNAIVNGVQSHYICPSEGICSTCPTTGGIKNGDFELGANGDWRLGTRRNQPLITSNAGVTPRSGSYVAQLGVVNSETSSLAQTVQLPNQGPVSLRYHYQTRSTESRCTRERAEVRINNRRVAVHNLCSSQNTSQWVPVTLDLSRYAGRSVTVQFYLKTNNSLPSTFLLDDAAVVNAAGVQASMDEEVNDEESEEEAIEHNAYLPFVSGSDSAATEAEMPPLLDEAFVEQEFNADETAVSAAATTVTLLPTSYTTTNGAAGGQPVSNLHLQDQSGTQNDWDKYVEFITPGSKKYIGYRSYTLPTTINPTTMTALQLNANYLGPLKSYQTWTWTIYNWSTKKWVKLGNNGGAAAWQWKLFTFNAGGTLRNYVNATTREIRVRLQSNNTKDDMDLDYEAVVISHSGGSTPTNAYYVATSGSDANPGTLNAPWRTIQKAANTASPGSTVQIRGGVYNESIKVNISGSAAAGYTTFQSYPGETAIVDGTGLTVPDADTALFLIDSRSYIAIKGLVIRNYRSGTSARYPNGIFVTGSAHHLKLEGNTIHNIETTVTNFTGSNGAGAHGILILGTNNNQPIDNVLIDNNELRNLRLGWSEALTLNGNVTNFTLTNNRIHDTNNIGIDISGGYDYVRVDAAVNRARNGLIRGNLLYNISSNGNPAYGNNVFAAGAIYVDGGSDVVIEQNTIHHADFGIELAAENPGWTTRNVIARNNFVYLNNSAGIAIGGYESDRGGAEDCWVLNNTFFRNNQANEGTGEFYLQYNARNNVIKNNIFYTGNDNQLIHNRATTNGNNAIDYNLYFAPAGVNNSMWQWRGVDYSGFNSYQQASGNDAHSLFVDPQLNNLNTPNLHLLTTSPAINRGQALTESGNTDYDGNARNQGSTIDIGADEAF